MNILIVHCGKKIFGGAELVISKLTNYLYEQGHGVKIVAKDMPASFCSSIPPDISYQQQDTYWGLRSATQRLIGWADVVNVHNFPATLTMFPVRTTTRGVVWMCNEPAELFTNWWRKPIEALNRWWVKSSGMGVVVADKYNANRFERIYKVRPRIIHYGVDHEFWSKKIPFKADKNRIRLLQVGTISPYKNQLESLYALTDLLRAGIDVSITFVGEFVDEQYRVEVMKFKQYDTDNRITFLGQQSREEIRELFNKYDVLLHPVKGQGGWLVPFEAMCAGLPVITTPTFSASDLIREEGLGIVTNRMAQAVIIQQYKKLDVGAISQWVEGTISWDKFGQEMVNAYQANIGE